LKRFIDESSIPTIQQSILRFTTIDGKTVSVQVVTSTNEEMIRVIIPSFKITMYYDPDFALLLGGEGESSNNPCGKIDLTWTWICLSFLLFVIVLSLC